MFGELVFFILLSIPIFLFILLVYVSFKRYGFLVTVIMVLIVSFVFYAKILDIFLDYIGKIQ
jgi:hypothetical protein